MKDKEEEVISKYNKKKKMPIRGTVPHKTMEYQRIILGSVERFIPKYSDILRMELEAKSSIDNNPMITSFQYYGALFNNLGFNCCPSSSIWINLGIPLQLVRRDTVIDFPLTYYPLMFNKEGTNLKKLLDCIYIWSKGDIKKGHLLDMENSYILPEHEELQYLIDNKMVIKYNHSVNIDESYWSSADIRTSRIHNLNPMINQTYFENSIRKFNEYSQYIKIYNPCCVFAMALINPDLIMSFIRNSEIKAAKKANQKYNDAYVYRQDYDMIYLFQNILNGKIGHLNKIYEKYGFDGLIVLNNNFTSKVEMEVTLAENMANKLAMKMTIPPLGYDRKDISHPDGSLDEFAIMNQQDKELFVKDVDLDSGVKSYIAKFVDKENLPQVLSAKILYPDGSKYYTDLYIDTMKRLYIVLQQIEFYFPEYLDLSDRLVISSQFFLGNNKFALFNKEKNMYIVVTPEFKSYILSPDETIKFYKNFYNEDVLLDSEEIDSESPEVPDFDIENFDIESVIDNKKRFNPDLYIQNIDDTLLQYT